VTFGYGYNPAGEIVSNTRSNDAYSFTLANANVASTANGLNQLNPIGGASATHDGNGNVSAIGSAGYGYDSENRLVSAPGGTTLAYDPLGRLYSLSAGGTTRLFLYDGDHLFGEYATNGTPPMFYEHGPGVDEPVMSFNYTTFEFGTFHGDERGNVVAAVAAGGTSINRYDDYGNPQGGAIWRFTEAVLWSYGSIMATSLAPLAIQFVRESYSPALLLALPAILTVIGHAWKRAAPSHVLIWIFASLCSAAIYVIGSAIVDGVGPLVGLAFVLTLIVQMPISLAASGLCALACWMARRK
jgi:hypothetical protein